MSQLTWGEFKKKVEVQGAVDTDTISWIDFDGWDTKIEVDKVESDISISN